MQYVCHSWQTGSIHKIVRQQASGDHTVSYVPKYQTCCSLIQISHMHNRTSQHLRPNASSHALLLCADNRCICVKQAFAVLHKLLAVALSHIYKSSLLLQYHTGLVPGHSRRLQHMGSPLFICIYGSAGGECRVCCGRQVPEKRYLAAAAGVPCRAGESAC